METTFKEDRTTNITRLPEMEGFTNGEPLDRDQILRAIKIEEAKVPLDGLRIAAAQATLAQAQFKHELDIILHFGKLYAFNLVKKAISDLSRYNCPNCECDLKPESYVRPEDIKSFVDEVF